MKVKVLITIGKLDVGGAEMRILRLLQYFQDANKFDVIMYVVSGEKGVLTNSYVDAGVEISYGRKGAFGLLGFAQELIRSKPDVMHVNASLAGGVYCFVGWVCKVKRRISHIRTTEDYSKSKVYRFKKPVYQALLNCFSTRVVGVCDSARNLSRTPEHKWKTVYNGFESHDRSLRREYLGEREIEMVVIGRMHEVKNQVFAVAVLAALIGKGRSARLSFYGEEDIGIRSTIEDKAKGLGVSSYVFFHGPTNKPLDILGCYDVLCLPSTREGLPGVVIEAASCGVPSVCSPLPGCLEISNKLSSVKLASLDDVEDWVSKITALIELDPKFVLQEFDCSGFTLDNHVHKMEELWVGNE